MRSLIKDPTIVALDFAAQFIQKAKTDVINHCKDEDEAKVRLQAIYDVETSINSAMATIAAKFDPEALEDKTDAVEETIITELSDSDFKDMVNAMSERQRIARAAKKGSFVGCPVCLRHFSKSSYQQSFCSNAGKSNCKEVFYTTIRSARAKKLGVSRP
ncbi:hypothetical protein [Vibrio phage vB_VhaS-a]|nr:hypothetical protein [Vibrio phage vB_VhaS-a]